MIIDGIGRLTVSQDVLQNPTSTDFKDTVYLTFIPDSRWPTAIGEEGDRCPGRQWLVSESPSSQAPHHEPSLPPFLKAALEEYCTRHNLAVEYRIVPSWPNSNGVVWPIIHLAISYNGRVLNFRQYTRNLLRQLSRLFREKEVQRLAAE